MNREEIKAAVRDRIKCSDYLERSKNGLYICPFCGSGTGPNRTGALKVYETNTWTCHACNKSGDVIDLFMKRTGADFNTALSLLAEQCTLVSPAGVSTQTQADSRKSAEADYSAYYESCRARLDDPRAIAYLEGRGISLETARRAGVGFDPAADPASNPGHSGGKYACPRIIIPTSKTHYVGRAIDPSAEYPKMNPKGGTAGIFNQAALYSSDICFVVEGWADALSVMESGADALALNSASNSRILLQILEGRPTTARLVLALDNDKAGERGIEELATGLARLGIAYSRADICSGAHDPNEALLKNRDSFLAAVRAAGETPKLPGLLRYDALQQAFRAADDRIIEIKSFPIFSRLAKIKAHATIAIAADTGGGKSSLALNFLNDLSENYPAIYFNLEMDQLTVYQRLVAISSGIELDKIERYRRDDEIAEAVNIYLKKICERAPLQIIQDAYYLEDIARIIQQATEGREDPTMVFIDHSLLVDSKEAKESRYERFTKVSEELRKIALRYNIVLFVLLQQNRAGKANAEERPKNSSLKESGSWENDATHILFLWLDPETNRRKLILTKNRAGGVGEISLNYSPETQIYCEGIDADTDIKTVKPKQSRRDAQREKLQRAIHTAQVRTGGRPTLAQIAEAADVKVATVRSWINEFGGAIVDGKKVDPAGINEKVDVMKFVPFEDDDEITASF